MSSINDNTASFSELKASWKAWEDNVIIHENAHMSAGGGYVGAPTYEYEIKEDGEYYIVAGEVPVDMTFDPSQSEAMILKFTAIAAAAMAPSDPSGQDFSVAGEAQVNIARAIIISSKNN